MGLIWSRWRKKASTEEVLELLEKEIESHEKLKRQNLQQQKEIIGRLIVWSITLYIVLAIIFYLSYSPPTLMHKVLFSLPYVCFPLLIWLVKRMLHWYFVKRLARNDATLTALRERKQEIIEEVMEKETYKKAKALLEKYDNEKFKQLEKSAVPATPKTPGQELRNRNIRATTGPSTLNGPNGPHPNGVGRGTPAGTPLRPIQRGSPPGPMGSVSQTSQMNGQHRPGMSGAPLIRPILPRERTAVDKLVEYLVGDGPQNRFALICRHCFSHNGMALKEEFEYIAFRCCYCHAPNPARKNRPHAPKLPLNIPEPASSSATSAQSSEQEDKEEKDKTDKTSDKLEPTMTKCRTPVLKLTNQQPVHQAHPCPKTKA